MEIPNREELDVEATEVMQVVLERHRVQLQAFMGRPPVVERVPDWYWRKIRREYEEELAAILILIFLSSAETHGWFTAHGTADTTAQTQARMWSAQQASQSATAILHHTVETLERKAEVWRERRQQAEAEYRADPDHAQELLDELEQEINETWESLFGEGRAAGIALDQVTTAQTAGGEWSMRGTYGLSLEDTWYTERDDRVCPVCEPLDGAERMTWAAEFTDGPPAHPNCRCWIQYVNLPNLPP